MFKNHVYVYAENSSDSKITHTAKAGTEFIVLAIKPSKNSHSMFGYVKGTDDNGDYSGWVSLNSCNLKTRSFNDAYIEKSHYRDWTYKKTEYAF